MALLDKYEAKFYCVATETQIGINVRHYQTTEEEGGGVAVQDMADLLSGIASFAYRSWLHNSASYLGCTLQVINVVPPVTAPFVSTNGAGVGNALGDLLPRQVAGLIHIKGAVPGKHGRGRAYIPFGSSIYNGNDGKLSGAGLAALDAVRVFLAADRTFVDGALSTTIRTRLRNRATNDLTIVEEMKRDDRWATQRRRGSFGRTNPIPF